MCQCKLVAEEVGNIQNIQLRDVNLEYVKPSFEHGDNNHAERGLYAFELNGIDDAYFDNVRVKIPSDIDLKLYSEENSVNIRKKYCNF
jgi:hypothetical protein